MNINTAVSVDLEYREGSSDKVYRAAIEPSGDGHVVNFAYGRRGSTLNAGTKTQRPVSYDEARKIYEKLVKSKTAKGYRPVGSGSGLGMIAAQRADTGLRPQLPVAIDADDGHAVRSYLEDDNWGLQEKHDGRRMMIRNQDGLAACNRNGLATATPAGVAASLREVRTGFVVDGECVGETYYVFDLLEFGRDIRDCGYAERLAALCGEFGNLGPAVVVVETVTGTLRKKTRFEKLRALNREGAVFKDLDARWSQGSSPAAVKAKFWTTCSCVVAAVNARRSVALALDGVGVGNVGIPPNAVMPEPGQVVEIRYLYVAGPGGSLYQPVYLGIRDDIGAEACGFGNQHLKYKAA